MIRFVIASCVWLWLEPLGQSTSALAWANWKGRVTVAHHGIDDVFLVSKKQSRQRFRRSILEAWGWRCAYCETCLSQQATLDHVIPISRGGPTSKGNLVAACARCNVAKSDLPLEGWYRCQAFYSRRREWAIWWWRLTHGSLPLPPWGP